MLVINQKVNATGESKQTADLGGHDSVVAMDAI
jgi:hypothetical protein